MPRSTPWRRKLFPLAASAIVLCMPAMVRADELADAVTKTLSAPIYRHAKVGVHVVALGTGRVIYARNANDLFTPASNQKLITAAAALQELGAEYVFQTRLCGVGALADGTLEGDILLEACGDPTIGGQDAERDALAELRIWAKGLHEAGIRQVTGDVVVDDSFFDRVFYNPSWPASDAHRDYAPPVGAATVNDNCVTIHARPGSAAGQPAVLSRDPACAPLDLVNSVRTTTRSGGISFARQGDSRQATISGFVKLGSAGESGLLTVPDPTLYTACVLKTALEAENIAVDGSPRAIADQDTTPPERRLVFFVRKTPIVNALGTMMRESHNLTAEVLVKTLGAEAEGRGTWPDGLKVAGFMLKELGFKEDEFTLDDGSGLSRKNKLSPALLTAVLLHMHSSPTGKEYVASLAVAGRTGTLARSLNTAPYKGNVRAKTGYIRGVSGLSGYAKTRSDTAVAFSILINDDRGSYSFRVLREKICMAIVDHAR